MVLRRHLDKGGCNCSHRISFCLPLAIARRFHFLLLAFALISSFAVAARADTVGGISGKLTVQTWAVIPDTEVTALYLDSNLQQTSKSNGNGIYNFTALPVGRYEIEVIREGF